LHDVNIAVIQHNCVAFVSVGERVAVAITKPKTFISCMVNVYYRPSQARDLLVSSF